MFAIKNFLMKTFAIKNFLMKTFAIKNLADPLETTYHKKQTDEYSGHNRIFHLRRAMALKRVSYILRKFILLRENLKRQ